MRTDETTILYRLYDSSGRLLYIGITFDWDVRESQHAQTKDWWPAVEEVEFMTYETRALAASAEREAIIEELPLHNVEHHPAYVQQRYGAGAYL